MIPLNSLISVEKDSTTSIYLQIANGIIRNIRGGHLRRGLKLPGARILAKAFDIHRKTVQMALDELFAQGWLEIIPRKGTFIAKNLPETKPVKINSSNTSSVYPSRTTFALKKNSYSEEYPLTNFQTDRNLILTVGFPDIRLAPMPQLMREIRSIEKRGGFKKYYHYGSAQGSLYLREALSTFLSETRGLSITPNNIIITSGAQMGLYLTSKLLVSKGDEVIVGEPGYSSATMALQRAGAVINRVAVDDCGIKVDEIEALCKRKKVRLVYIIPHHHNPTTVTLNPERRIRLLDLAARYKFALIEDDYDYDFHYASRPVLPMASLDRHGNVIYIGTLSKTLVPAVRIGFIVAPENFIEAATEARRSIEFHGDAIMEVAIAELYNNGVIANHIKKAVKIYRERRDNFCALLTERMGDRITFKIPEGGMSVWVAFNDLKLKKIAERARKMGLTMSDGSSYNKIEDYNATRLGFSSLNPREQEKAIDIIRKCS